MKKTRPFYFTIFWTTLLVVFLGFSVRTEAQKNPNSLVKKQLRLISKGKTDTITALTKIVNALDLKKLKSKNRKKAIKGVESNYKIALNSSNNRIQQLITKTEAPPNPYEGFKNYVAIIQIYNHRLDFVKAFKNLQTSTSFSEVENQEQLEEKIMSFSEKRENARSLAAKYFYEKGKSLLEKDTQKISYHNAYKNFVEARKLISNYEDTQELMKVAQEKGAVYIKILPLEVNGSKYTRKTYEDIKFSVSEYIQKYDNSTPFLHLGWQITNPDVTVKLLVDAPTLKNTREKPTTEDIKRSIELDDEEKKIEVKATLTNYSKNSEANIKTTAYIKDNQGIAIKKLNYVGHNYWSDYWATYSGDERALKKRTKRKIREEKPYPPEQTMIESAVKNLVADLDNLFKHLQIVVR